MINDTGAMSQRSKMSARKQIILGVAFAAALALVIGVAYAVGQPDTDSNATPAAESSTAPPSGGGVVWIGDSYISGDGAPAGGGLALLAANELGLTPTISADPRSGYTRPGRRGFTTGELVAEAPERVGTQLVVIASGYNDDLGSPPNTDRLRAEAASAISAAEQKWPRARVVVLGPWTPGAAPTVNQTAANEALGEVAAAAGATYIDTLSPPLVTPAMIGADKVHPSPTGHQQIAADLADRLRAATA
ncbi:lipase [Gordonia phage Bowser]|uniref:Lipase n=1 Tax=Gordonia phage Bowser TaxID=1838063 RepID=A0A160DCK2_9CAUD|nr:lipase [Gordonia phage Bowser]ANA85426.1 lipase [Gordonia phage Bowser]